VLLFDARCHVDTSIITRDLFLGDFFIPAFQCPHRVERVGTLGDGGKWVCGLERVAKQGKCVIYSFGLYLTPLCRFDQPHIKPPRRVIS
jgi:hypothetical protein